MYDTFILERVFILLIVLLNQQINFSIRSDAVNTTSFFENR